jgi:hypothetical protein
MVRSARSEEELPTVVRALPDSVDNITFAVQPVGWVGEWHQNPKPQWVIPISGPWSVETTDGKKVTMGPGDASFGGDQGAHAGEKSGSVGHRSGTVGDHPAVLRVVQLKETADLHVGDACRFR